MARGRTGLDSILFSSLLGILFIHLFIGWFVEAMGFFAWRLARLLACWLACLTTEIIRGSVWYVAIIHALYSRKPGVDHASEGLVDIHVEYVYTILPPWNGSGIFKSWLACLVACLSIGRTEGRKEGFGCESEISGFGLRSVGWLVGTLVFRV